MTEPTGSAAGLPHLVRRTRERLVTLLVEADPDAAAWVEAVRTARPGVPTVVVVGETKRGKSSLVNALLAAPELSPVDADAATAGYLVLRHGPEWTASAHYPDGASLLGDPAALGPWLLAGRAPPDGRPPDRAPPRWVEVTAPIPLLERLTLVDTPGVGGFDAAHGELALEAAAAATALLFVADASAPLTRGELEFLARLGERVETVLFALTKTDAYRGWREILHADRDLLARHAPRFADAEFHPVSARLFAAAATAPTPEVATMLRERSGVAELQTALQRQVAGRAVMLGEANSLRALGTALDVLAARLEAGIRALRAAEGTGAALRARRAELIRQRRSSSRGWQLRLRGAVQRVKVESSHDVAAQIRAAHAQLRAQIDAADRAGLARLPYQVDAALQLLGAQVAAGLTRRVAATADAALAELFDPGELAALRAQLARGGPHSTDAVLTEPGSVVLRPPERRPAAPEDKLLVAMGVSAGLGIGKVAVLPLAGLGAAAGAVVLPVSVVLGLGAGWWLTRARRHAADKQQLKQWLSDVLAEARAACEAAVSEQLIDAEQQLALALDEALARRVAAIEDELREVDRALRMDTTERSRELTVTQSRLQEVRAGREQVTGLLRRIRELRDR